MRATEQLRKYTEKLEAINTDTPFGKRRIDYYKNRANNFLNTKKWLSFRTGYFEKISTELVQQLRGTADRRQVAGARLALQHNLGLGGACVVTLYERV